MWNDHDIAILQSFENWFKFNPNEEYIIYSSKHTPSYAIVDVFTIGISKLEFFKVLHNENLSQNWNGINFGHIRFPFPKKSQEAKKIYF